MFSNVDSESCIAINLKSGSLFLLSFIRLNYNSFSISYDKIIRLLLYQNIDLYNIIILEEVDKTRIFEVNTSEKRCMFPWTNAKIICNLPIFY